MSPKGLSVTQAVEGRPLKVLGQMDRAIEVGMPVLLVAELTDNSNHDSFFAPPQPTTLRLSLGDGGAEINLALSEEYKKDGFCWPVIMGGDAEIFDVDSKDLMGRQASSEAAGQGRRRRKSQLSNGSDRSETRAVPSPPPEPAPSHEVTSCCRQS
ncbi:unnamed protein product [Effrenium voratum]|nr:unnamed protein product [Effrenium voratum]CAJ1458265.1 unnamed protein product [Effrenium voratum]